MQATYNNAAPKKPTNVSINSDLLAQARACKINLSATLEQALADKVAQVQREQWLKENQQAINGYNQLVDEQGVFSDGLRSF
ncbi:MAG: acetoacetyl-CoA synthase [Thalassobium sp.]|uniref:Type II toxin-antitoxin system CcdA family antitoxin n=1 Tax=Thalassolituus pacificus TaxID=2975440 RepID=A0A9X3ASR2_9GAMM|nr:type II toxin-antitoxin system CcdA family antitoxin [Thalassolituus pacificus]MCT7359253.1 type II toxin-antitoxin system CcdA family antitoxin [Thalassolituus pacificus]PHS65549.1 MAG: acetoacetyl-CoA synthase [Thalassobium sp.]